MFREETSLSHSCIRIWQKLGEVSRLEFTARSLAGTTGWNGEGRGKVTVSLENDHNILFIETGNWNPECGSELDPGKADTRKNELAFSNKYRWTLLDPPQGISLSHLRYGEQNPVHLVELVGDQENKRLLKSATPHICNMDKYTLDMYADGDDLTLIWKIEGPAKNEQLIYRYR